MTCEHEWRLKSDQGSQSSYYCVFCLAIATSSVEDGNIVTEIVGEDEGEGSEEGLQGQVQQPAQNY